MKNVANKIFTNTVLQVTFRTFDVLFGVLTLALITRYLGQEGFGHYTTVNAILQLFIIVVDLGLYLTLLREISAQREEEAENITNNIFTMRFVSATALLALAALLIWMTPYPTSIKMGVFGLSFAFLFTSITSVVTALFQKYLQMGKVAFAALLGRIVLLITVVAIIAQDGGLQNLFYASSVSSLIVLLIVMYYLKKLPRPIHLRFRFDFTYWKRVLTIAWPIAVTTALNLIYFKADTVILSLFQSQEVVGLYGASYRVIEIITTFPHMFMGLILPLLTAAWIAQDINRLRTIWSHAFLFFAALTLPLLAGTVVVGRPLMELIAGNEFVVSGDILKVLIIAATGIFFGTLYTYMVITLEKQRSMIKFFLATAVFSLIGYAVFIPLYSYWGAAWMTVVSELLIILAAWYVVRKEVVLPTPLTAVMKCAFASIIMGLGAYAMLPYLTLLPTILISIIVYVIIIIALKAISLTDIRQLIRPSHGTH